MFDPMIMIASACCMSMANVVAAAPHRDAQTGHRGGVSYTCLVFNRDHSQAAHQLGMHIVPFVIHGGAAK